MSRSKIILATVATATGVVALAGCAKLFPKQSDAAKHGALFAVTAEKTPFFRYGPQQGQGPDRELTRDTLVTVIRHAFAYSKVRLADGEKGFVANEDIARAPERLIAENNSARRDDVSDLPPTPPVKLPAADNSPEFEPTPIPQELMPQ
jgi:hypothetical protein